MRLSDERLKEMIGAGVPCVPANEAEAAAMAREVMEAREEKPVAFLVCNFIIARHPVKAKGRFPETKEYLYPASREQDARGCARTLRGDCIPLYARNFLKDKETDNAGE